MAATLATWTETPVDFLTVIEDDPDVQLLIKTIFSMDSRFSAANAAETAEEALESARKTAPGIVVLDHGLARPLTGLAAAPLLKKLAHARRSSCSQPTPNSGPALQLSPLSTRSAPDRPNKAPALGPTTDRLGRLVHLRSFRARLLRKTNPVEPPRPR